MHPSVQLIAAELHSRSSRSRLLRGRVLGAAALPLAVLGAAWPRLQRHVRHDESAPAATGRVEGLVVISKALAARRPRFRLYAGDGAALVPPAAAEPNERDNVIVYLTPVSGEPAEDEPSPRVARAEMQQRGERFVPHVLPVVRGTTVDFPNEDAVFHNVFSLSSAKSFDLGRYPRGGSKSIVFDRVGTVQVFCHIHSDMSAIVLVLPNPLFARPDSSGRFALDAVPTGDYVVTGWHERIRPITRRLRVEAGRTQTVDFDIPLPPDEQRGR